MALTLSITAAGRAALRNADGTGTKAVKIASVGVTATAFAPGAAVPSEIKRLTTIAGGATAADTIHATIMDSTTDTYTVRGFGLYLDDNVTLFASYGQANVIVEKSAGADMALSLDIQFADVAASQITFGNTNFFNPQATTETIGVVELATDAEATTGADAQRAVTPKALLAVLDSRLGKGAPTTLAKQLLASLSAADVLQLLGILGAAGYDVGAGHGLDADLLDGQHGAYYLNFNNLTNIPATWVPAKHEHDAADVTTGVFPVARGGTGRASVTAGAYLTGNGVGYLVEKTPAQVLADIGAAAKSHSHAIADVTGLQTALDAKAPLASPALTGAPTAPTPVAGDVTTRVATTAFVSTAVSSKAPLASPALTGTPTAPTPASGTNNTQLATTAFVVNALAPMAPLASPALTGTPTAPTAAKGTNTTQLATTSFVASAIADLVASAPGTLDTLKELADALGDDPNFATTMTNALAGKAALNHTHAIADVTGLQSALDGKAPRYNPTVYGTNLRMRDPTDALSRYYWEWVDTELRLCICDDNGSFRSTAVRINRATGGLSTVSSIAAGGAITTTQYLSSSTAALVLAALGNGTVFIRPNGNGVTTGQTTVGTDGTLTATGPVIGNQNFTSSTGTLVLGTNGSGAVYLRPNGPNSASGQVFVDSGGKLEVTSGTLRVGSSAGLYRDYHYDGTITASGTFNPQTNVANASVVASGNYGGGYALYDGAHAIAWWSDSGTLVFGAGASGGAMNPTVTITAGGAITASGGYQYSDRRLKRNITRKPVTRGMALQLARAYKSWDMRDSGDRGEGIVAQTVQRIAPAHVIQQPKGKRGAKRLAVDKAGVSLEASCDNALAIEELAKQNAALLRRIERLERNPR